MKTAVDKVGSRQGRGVVNAPLCGDVRALSVRAGLLQRRLRLGEGRVEKDVQDSRRRIWQDALDERFGTFAELNAWLGERCRAVMGRAAHPELRGLTIAEALEHERPQLMPMPSRSTATWRCLARVSSTCLVTVQRNRYSVPCELAGHVVSVRLYPERIVIVVAHEVIAEPRALLDRDQVRYDWRHYIAVARAQARGAAQRRAVRRPAGAIAAAAARAASP